MFRIICDHNNDKFHHDDLNIKSMIMINVNMIDHNDLKHYDHNYDNNKCDNDDLTHCNHDHEFGDNTVSVTKPRRFTSKCNTDP